MSKNVYIFFKKIIILNIEIKNLIIYKLYILI